jgi:hypothetical protein
MQIMKKRNILVATYKTLEPLRDTNIPILSDNDDVAIVGQNSEELREILDTGDSILSQSNQLYAGPAKTDSTLLDLCRKYSSGVGRLSGREDLVSQLKALAVFNGNLRYRMLRKYEDAEIVNPPLDEVIVERQKHLISAAEGQLDKLYEAIGVTNDWLSEVFSSQSDFALIEPPKWVREFEANIRTLNDLLGILLELLVLTQKIVRDMDSLIDEIRR